MVSCPLAGVALKEAYMPVFEPRARNFARMPHSTECVGLHRAVAYICAALLSCYSSTAGAVQNPRFTVYGAGASSCISWLSERKSIAEGNSPTPAAWEQMGWVLGYATAFSQHAQRPSDAALLPTGQRLAAMLDSYCVQRPSDILAAAMTIV